MTAALVLASVLALTGQPSANPLISAAQAAASTLLACTVAELARRGWRWARHKRGGGPHRDEGRPS